MPPKVRCRPNPEADERPPIDLEAVERLIQGNKPVRAKDRELSTGPMSP
jgi:hypothetical protein